MLSSLINYAQPNFSNQFALPSWGAGDPRFRCINYQWENDNLSSFSNWNLDGSNVAWQINCQNFSIKEGYLYKQASNVPSSAPVNNYHLVFNYRTTPMEWGPIISHYYNLNANSLEEVSSFHYTSNSASIYEKYNYELNPKKVLQFPFNYLDSFSDAFYSDSSGFDTLTATYVGYGNLSIPAYGTNYSNVAKIKYETNAGNFYIFWKDAPWLVPVLFVDSLTNSFELLVDSNLVSSTKENELSKIQIYPNPAKDKITIQGFSYLTKVKLTDMYGRQIPYELDVHGQISLEHIVPGVYFIAINSNTNKQQQFKFLKIE